MILVIDNYDSFTYNLVQYMGEILIEKLAGADLYSEIRVFRNDKITIPEIGTFRAVGKTELELTETIRNLVSPRLVKDPMITVVVTGPRKKIYSISGAIAAPGPYVLNESDFRISRALAAAGGIPQTNADNAYVIRTRGFWPGAGGS